MNVTFTVPTDAAWEELPAQVAASREPLVIIREDQSSRWVDGNPVAVEAYLERFTTFSDEDTLALVMAEVALRRSRGQTPTPQEYQSRFPHLAADIAIQFELADCMSPSAALCGTLDHVDTEKTTPHILEEERNESLIRYPVVPGYRLVGEIARGGMGVVWAAKDLSFDRDVAIKTLLRTDPGSIEARRFVIEARITGQLQHPGIPPV